MSFVANGQFSLIPYNEIRPKTETDDGAKGVKSSFIQLSSDAISEATLTYFINEEGDGRGALWQKKFTLALADNTHDLDEDFTDCERSGADRATKFWSKFAFTMAVAGGFNEGTIADISDTTNPLNYLQTNCSYLNRIPRARLSDENYCTLGVMRDAIGNGQGNFYIISLAPYDKTRMGDVGAELSRLLSGFSTAGMGIPVIIDTSKSFTKMVEVFNNREGEEQATKFCYMRTAASIADPSTTPGVDNMVVKFGINNVYCEYLEGERVVAADDLVGNVKITYTNLQFNSISSNNRDQVTTTYTITGGPLANQSEQRILVANTGPKHFNSINYVKSEFLIAQRGLAANPVFAYPETLFKTQILGGRAQFYGEFNAMLNGKMANDVVKTLMKTYTMGCARKRTSDAAQGDDCDKLPSLKFHKLNLDGKSLKTEGEGVKMTTKGVMVTIDRLLFARQVAKCPGAAAILDSGTHMIVYIPGEGAAVKAAEGKVEPVGKVAPVGKEGAPPKRPEPLTDDEKRAINNKLRDERRFRRNAIAREAETKGKVAADATVFTVSDEAKSADDAASEVVPDAEDLNWTKFFTDFFAQINPAGSDAGKGGANTRESQLDGLYQTGGDPTADDLDLSTILSYLYIRGEKIKRPHFYGKFRRIIDQIRSLFNRRLVAFRYYNDQTHNAVYICNAKDAIGNDNRSEYINSYLNGLRAADSVDPFGEGFAPDPVTPRVKPGEVIFHIVYWDGGKSPAADFSIVRHMSADGPIVTLIGSGFGENFPLDLDRYVTLKEIFDNTTAGNDEVLLGNVLRGTTEGETVQSDAAPSPSPSDGASADMGGGASPSITSIFRAPFNTLSSTENLAETNIAVMNSLLNLLCNYETSFINYREGRDAFYNIINDGFPLKMLPNIVMASSVEVYVFVKLMLDDYTADRAKTINYGLFEYYLYSQKDNNYIYTCLQDIKDYILGTNMYYISPTETDIIPDETRAYFEDLCTRTVSLSGQIYSQTYDLTNTGDYEAIYQLASDNYLTMGGFHELSEIFMTKTGEILQALPSDVLAKYGEQVTEAVEESKREEKADVGKGIGYFLPRGPTNRVPSQVQARPPTGAGGANTNLKKSIKKHRTRKLTRGKKRDNGKKHTRKRGIKRRHHTKRKF